MKRGKSLQRRTPLRAKAPLRSTAQLKRGGPIKAKRKPAPPKAEAAHLERIVAMPCCVPGCGAPPPSTKHHVTSDGYKRITRTDRRVVPLCNRHHLIQWGPRESVEAMGHARFNEANGIDLLQLADRLWQESCGA